LKTKRMANARRGRLANKQCSMARAMAVVGDRWSILILREAFYGVKRFDEFEHYIGIAPNILSNRLKKLVGAGVMTRLPLVEHAGRYASASPQPAPACSPAFPATKKWGDDWLAEPEGPQVVFRERGGGRAVQYPELRTASGKPLRLEDVELVAGSGAVPFNRKRFGEPVAIAANAGKVSRRPRS